MPKKLSEAELTELWGKIQLAAQALERACVIRSLELSWHVNHHAECIAECNRMMQRHLTALTLEAGQKAQA